MIWYSIYAHGMSGRTYSCTKFVRTSKESLWNREYQTNGTRDPTNIPLDEKKINLNSAVVVVAGHGGGVSRGETRKGIAMLKSKIKY